MSHCSRCAPSCGVAHVWRSRRGKRCGGRVARRALARASCGVARGGPARRMSAAWGGAWRACVAHVRRVGRHMLWGGRFATALFPRAADRW